jgi:hypothetical protein
MHEGPENARITRPLQGILTTIFQQRKAPQARPRIARHTAKQVPGKVKKGRSPEGTAEKLQSSGAPRSAIIRQKKLGVVPSFRGRWLLVFSFRHFFVAHAVVQRRLEYLETLPESYTAPPQTGPDS